MKISALIALLTLFFCFQLYSQQDVKLEAKVDRSVITVGDTITYSVLVKFNEGTEIQIPNLGANLGMFEIKQFDTQTDKNFKKLVFVISTYFAGEFEIPPIELTYKNKDGIKRTIKTSKIKISVKSVIPGVSADTEPRDIKNPLKIKGKIPEWIYGLLLFSIMCATSYVLYQRFKGVPIENIFRKEEPQKPADEIAMLELENLEKSALISEGRLKEFYIIVSEIIRKYINRRYNIPTMERTTEEILNDIKILNIRETVHGMFENYFSECDMVKFAKYKPTPTEHKSIIPKARELVDMTKEIRIAETTNLQGQESESQL